MVKIRPAVQADQERIRYIVRVGHLPPFSLTWSHFLVAEDEGQVIGVGQIRHHGIHHELGSLAVLPEYRGQGVAAALIAALEGRAGYPLYLFCRDRLEPFYHRFGYRRVGFREAPGRLRLKAWPAFVLPRLLGFRVLLMCKAG